MHVTQGNQGHLFHSKKALHKLGTDFKFCRLLWCAAMDWLRKHTGKRQAG